MDKYADWPTKQAAAQLIGTSVRTLERIIERGKIQTAERRIPGRKPMIVCSPADVERLQEGTAQPAPWIVPATVEVQTAPRDAAVAVRERVALPDLLRQVIDGRHTPRFLTLPDAAKYVGLPEAYLRRLVRDGKLKGVKSGAWYVRTSDLDRL